MRVVLGGGFVRGGRGLAAKSGGVRGEVELEGCSRTRPGIDLNVAAARANDAVDSGKAESSAFPRGFVVKKASKI